MHASEPCTTDHSQPRCIRTACWTQPPAPSSASVSHLEKLEGGSSGFAHSVSRPLLGKDFLSLLKCAIISPHRLKIKWAADQGVKVAELKHSTEYRKKQIRFITGGRTVTQYRHTVWTHSSTSGDRVRCRDKFLPQLEYQFSSRDT